MPEIEITMSRELHHRLHHRAQLEGITIDELFTEIMARHISELEANRNVAPATAQTSALMPAMPGGVS